jgi:4-hydroxybutyrate dehydrogenase
MSLIYYITQVQFDFGAVSLLQQECARVGITRPLIVTDAGVKAAGVLQKALDALPGLPVAVFDQTPVEPDRSRRARGGCRLRGQPVRRVDCCGGEAQPSIAPRALRSLPRMKGPLTHYATIEGGSPRITDRVSPIIAVPHHQRHGE